MRRRSLILLTAMSASFIAILDVTIVTVAIPSMVRELSSRLLTVRWAIQGYQLSFAIFTIVVPTLVARYGTKKTFISAIGGFTLASLACALSPTATGLNLSRIIQGGFAGVMIPTAFTLIGETFSPKDRGKAFGMYGLVIVTAPALGPVLGGILLERFHFSLIFLINLPLGFLVALAASAILPEGSLNRSLRWDIKGTLLLVSACVSLLLLASEASRAGWEKNLIFLSLFLLTGGAYLKHHAQTEHPVLPLSLFSIKSFRYLMLLNMVRAFTLFSRLFLLPILLERTFGFSPVRVGLIIAIGPIVSGSCMPLFGFLSDRYGPYPFLRGGACLMVLANSFMAWLLFLPEVKVVFLSIVLYGIGLGMLNAPLNSSAMNSVESRWMGTVSTYLTVLMNVVGALGVAITSSLLSFAPRWFPVSPLLSMPDLQPQALCFAFLGLIAATILPILPRLRCALRAR